MVSSYPVFDAYNRVEDPYVPVKTKDFGYTKSWKNAGNARKSSEWQDVEAYHKNINKKLKPFKKKVWKNIK
jgi:hypothetical protein